MTVRLIMFPLGRKQAMMAKKMQDLQPVLAEVKEKYKDDKEALTRETMAVWKRHKVNPAAGCVPALIQMPIFVGLWQTPEQQRGAAALVVPLHPRPRRARHDVPVPGHDAVRWATTSTSCRSWSSR